jgi:hypothetical protein
MNVDDYPGDSSPPAAEGPYGPPARWATLVSPVAPESVVMVLSSHRQWQVKQLTSGFVLLGSGSLEAVVAEGEVVPTDTGCRIQLAVQRAERSSIPATVAGGATVATGGAGVLAWWAGNNLWWLGAVLAIFGLVITAQLLGRLSERVTEEERAALVNQIVKALRGRELTT